MDTHSLNFRYGRRKNTQLPSVLMLIFVVVAGVAPNVYIHILSQFIVGVGIGGYRINSIVLGMSFMYLLCFLMLNITIILFVIALK